MRVQNRQPWVSSHVMLDVSTRAVEQVWPSSALTEYVCLQTALISTVAQSLHRIYGDAAHLKSFMQVRTRWVAYCRVGLCCRADPELELIGWLMQLGLMADLERRLSWIVPALSPALTRCSAALHADEPCVLQIQYDFNRNKYFDANAALEYGLIDKVLTPPRVQQLSNMAPIRK